MDRSEKFTEMKRLEAEAQFLSKCAKSNVQQGRTDRAKEQRRFSEAASLRAQALRLELG